MWMVNPKVMCRNHLLGEHVEVHMFAWNIDNKRAIDGYLANGLLEIHNLYCRHEEIKKEMMRRGYKHNSPLDQKWKHAEK